MQEVETAATSRLHEVNTEVLEYAMQKLTGSVAMTCEIEIQSTRLIIKRVCCADLSQLY